MTETVTSTGDKKPSTASQVRGDIQRGLTGDKRPGIDPAAAPMEADAEAGGTSPTQEEIDMARTTQAAPSAGHSQLKSRNFDTAMQPTAGTLEKKPSLPALVPGIVVVVIAAALLLGVVLR
ncbi:hypothetical protein [Rhizobium sp. SL86]|uniref:hypothetical protein n=1 Tax=Rhizobium sp. SL86 TaxID=2995148 RepID=UPI00227456E0|nr:hypothetical protein [Rhizobium sp. SL86]MCY1664637.1 hypothetical protein [Rhizobium sp. SL86]